MKGRWSWIAAMAAAAICAAAGSAASQDTTDDLTDLVGTREGDGETLLEARGYVRIGAMERDGRVWTRWWNSRSAACITITAESGRYQAVTRSPAPECGRGGRSTDHAPAEPHVAGSPDEGRPAATRGE